jgi:hypothetical protein
MLGVMVSRAQLKNIALSMPEAEEKSHFGQPDFRVRNKIFAGLLREGEIAWLKVASSVQMVLLTTRPEVFNAAAGAWGRSGWIYVQLSKVKPAELRALVRDSWRLVAPKTLTAAQEVHSRAQTDSSSPKRRAR